MDIKKNSFLFFFTIIILFGLCLRYFNNFYEGFWSDEVLTLIISDPFIDNQQMIKNWLHHDGSPIIYFYLTKAFLFIFGFSPENVRLLSILFSIFTILISIFFFKIRYKNEILLSAIFLVAINIFLVWQAKEARIPSTVSFFSMLNIIYFYFFIHNENKIYLTLLFIFNLFLISYYPFTVTILSAQFLYLCFLKRNLIEIVKYSAFYLLILLIYIYINFDYIQLHGSRGLGHIGTIDYKFFFNYFFSSYFGTYFFGGVSLILFSISLIRVFFKKIDQEDFIFFHIILIINTYIFLIIYTFFKTEIAVPRYFIFLIPSIIFVIIDLFANKKSKIYLYGFLIIALLNTIYGIQKGRIPKPPIKELIMKLSTEDTNVVFHNEVWFNVYLDNSRIINKKYKIIKTKDINNFDKIWFICFNNIRADRGNSVKLPDEEKCKLTLNKFEIIKEFNIPDFKIILLTKKNAN